VNRAAYIKIRESSLSNPLTVEGGITVLKRSFTQNPVRCCRRYKIMNPQSTFGSLLTEQVLQQTHSKPQN